MTDLPATAARTAEPRHPRKVKWSVIEDHLVLILGALLMLLPVLAVFMTSTLPDPEIIRHGLQLRLGDRLDDNFMSAMFEREGFTGEIVGTTMLMNSFILGIGFALGKIILGMMAAYGIVYFHLTLTWKTGVALGIVYIASVLLVGTFFAPWWVAGLYALIFPTLTILFRKHFATIAFWLIFTTLLLPLEVRILSTYEIVQGMKLLNTYTGLILPLVASATATFFFRQYFRSVPEELVEAARIDGAGPIKFFIDILVPLSKTMIAAMFIIMFVFGWNQYLWPTMITTEESMYTLVRGIKQLTFVLEGSTLPELGRANILALIAIVPPVLVVLIFQRWFVKGLTESDK